MISTEQLTDVFVEVADTLVADFDLVDFLTNVAEHTAAITGAQAVGLMLADQDGRLQFMASTSASGRALELLQIRDEEGPCLDCFHDHAPVINSDLRDATSRWPVFAPQATAAGFRSVHALPLRLRDTIIGTLNLFSDEAVRFDPDDVRVVQALADVATIAVLQERMITRAESLTEQLQGALNSRIVIEQAKGALSTLRGGSVDEAFTAMRAYARNHQQRLTDVAAAILSNPRALPALTRDEQ